MKTNKNNTVKNTRTTSKNGGVKYSNAEQAKKEKLILSKKSHALKEFRAFKISSSKTQEEAFYYASLTINDLLIHEYKKETGASEFKTFKQWKEEGYSVKKGSKAFRVWSAPMRANSTVEMVDVQTKETESVEMAFEFWGVCCLFNNLQVERFCEEDARPEYQQAEGENSEAQAMDERKTEEPSAIKAMAKICGASLKTAEKLRAIAEGLNTAIDRCFSERQTNTQKRLAQANRARAEGERLKRTQRAALALACLHESGEVPAPLVGIVSKKAIYDLVLGQLEQVLNGYHGYSIDTGRPALETLEARAIWALLGSDSSSDRGIEIRRKVEALQFSKIDGYFPTQGEALDILLGRANLEDGQKVADTSAGSGHIVDAIQCLYNVEIDAFEINHALSEVLRLKGHNAKQCDFLAEPSNPQYDRIVINPPFERLQDVEHVKHSFSFLKAGGQLTAIMSPSAFFRTDRKSTEFRAWFESVGGTVQDMPKGSFKSSGTNVDTKLITVFKD